MYLKKSKYFTNIFILYKYMFRVKFRRISGRFDNIYTLSIIHRFQKIHTHLGRVGNHQSSLNCHP